MAIGIVRLRFAARKMSVVEGGGGGRGRRATRGQGTEDTGH